MKNGYLLTFEDGNGVGLAEAMFISPEFTPKEKARFLILADARLLANPSTAKSAEWLKRLLTTGSARVAEIHTDSYVTISGSVFATTQIRFNPEVFDANISVEYSHNPSRV